MGRSGAGPAGAAPPRTGPGRAPGPNERAFIKATHRLGQVQAGTAGEHLPRFGGIGDRFPGMECSDDVRALGYGSMRP